MTKSLRASAHMFVCDHENRKKVKILGDICGQCKSYLSLTELNRHLPAPSSVHTP